MMNEEKKKWILSALFYLLLVLIGYYGYSTWIDIQNSNGNSTSHEHGSHDHGGGEEKKPWEEKGHGAHKGESEVTPKLEYDGRNMTISFKDKVGNLVKEFEVSHEKLLHLIIVSEDLVRYHHIHPTKRDSGEFQIDYPLPDGAYKAFIDAKPVGYGYHVEPLPFTVGSNVTPEKASLTPDEDFVSNKNGVTVTMTPTSLNVGEPITLDFKIEGGTPEPYLGALGHVVILDQNGEKFIHVHPLSENETRFETQFDQPGLYKIWGEFQFNGEVHIYPFVVEIK
jgi:hypothetical protein